MQTMRNSGEAEGPNTDGYYTAGIDLYRPGPGWRDPWHDHAIEFHSKDKAEAERMRDLALARLQY